MNEAFQTAYAAHMAIATLFEYVAAQRPEHCSGLSRMLDQQAGKLDAEGMHIASELLRGIQKAALSEDAAKRREESRQLLSAEPRGSA